MRGGREGGCSSIQDPRPEGAGTSMTGRLFRSVGHPCMASVTQGQSGG